MTNRKDAGSRPDRSDAPEELITPEQVRKWMAAMGFPVLEERLEALTGQVQRAYLTLGRLDELPLDDVDPYGPFRVPGPVEGP